MQVLDTNIIIDNPYVLEVEGYAIPLEVVGELNNLKSKAGKAGHNARLAMSKLLDQIVNENNTKVKVILPEEVGFTDEVIRRQLGVSDFNVICCAAVSGHTLVTSDQAVAVIAKLIGLDVEYVKQKKIPYTGYIKMHVDTDVVNSVASGTITPIPDMYYAVNYNDEMSCEIKRADMTPTTLMSNQYVKLIDINNTSHVTYARYDFSQQMFFPVKYKIKTFGIEPMPKNMGQTVLMDALVNPDIRILTVQSEAGAGKSLLTLAAALEQVNSKKPLYSKAYIFRSLEAVSEEIGFLPGDVDDKVDRWHDALYDSFELLLNKNKVVKQPGMITRDFMKQKLAEFNVEIGVLTFIRGRSLQNSFIIIDEAQNITPDVMRTIVSRCGVGTKLVICGDPSQIDNSKCSKEHNGLTHIVDSLHRRHLPQYAHITLEKCERSDIAEIAIKYL